MFTGIVDHCGTIVQLEREPQALTLVIECAFVDIAEGESIAVDGCCLTAIRPGRGRFVAQLSPETLRLTVAGRYEVGTRVNLERALRMGDRFGGHIVTGHVDETARVALREPAGEYVRFVFEGVSPAARQYLHKKGSVAVQGTSLTVNDVTPDGFEVMLIPHTLERTNLGRLATGDVVNLELDWMTKVILQAAQTTHAAVQEKGSPWKETPTNAR